MQLHGRRERALDHRACVVILALPLAHALAHDERRFRGLLAHVSHRARQSSVSRRRRPKSIGSATAAIVRRRRQSGRRIVCFPECFVPGYRGSARAAAPDPRSSNAPGRASRRPPGGERHRRPRHRARRRRALVATALVIDPDGTIAGFQDKVQIDPSEEGTYTPGSGRRVFRAGPLTFGVAICHEGWRYPETVRWAARRGAHVVFHPHFHEAEPGSYRPSTFADPANTFHEKAALCRAAENTCYFATVNYASPGSPTTSAIVRPDGTLLAYQPYGEAGLLIVDLDRRGNGPARIALQSVTASHGEVTGGGIDEPPLVTASGRTARYRVRTSFVRLVVVRKGRRWTCDHIHAAALGSAAPLPILLERLKDTAHQHSSLDIIANMTPAYMERVARVVTASAASLARAPAAPRSISVTGSATSNIQVNWSPPPRAASITTFSRPDRSPPIST